MSVTVKTVTDKVKSAILAVQHEVTLCRKALVGPVAVVAGLVAHGEIPGRAGEIAAAVVTIASYVGIRQTTNRS